MTEEERQAILDRLLADRRAATANIPGPATAAVDAAIPEPATATNDNGADAARQRILNDLIDSRRRDNARAEVSNMVVAGLEADSQARVKAVFAPTDSVAGFLGRVSRSATFGASDFIVAKIMQWRASGEIPDLTFTETLAAVREGFENQGGGGATVAADIVGSIAPGAGITKLGAAAWRVAAREGLVDGALRFAASKPGVARIAAALGAGSAGAAVEEGIRTSVDESMGAIVGEEFDSDRVVDSAIQGAVVGGIIGGTLQTVARGVGVVPGVLDVWNRLVRDGLGITSEETAQNASLRLFNAVRRIGETPEQAATRLQNAATSFAQKNGRMPAMSDLMAPEEVREVTDVVRFFNGLDRKLTTAARQSIDRSIESFERTLDSGLPTKSGEQLQAGVEDLFASVSQKFGQTPVAVSDDVITSLESSRAWISKQATHNPGARELDRILTARANVAAVRQRVGNLRNARNAAVVQEEVAKLDDEITALLSRPSTEAGARDEVASLGPQAGDDALGAIRNLRNILAAKVARMRASAAVNRAEQGLADVQPTLDAMDRALNDFRENGLKVALKDVNHLRAAASKFAARSQDLAEQETARAVRDTIAPVGTAEVPLYGRMVRLWRDTLTRVDAQATGAGAAQGTLDVGDIVTRVKRGRLPERSGRARGTAKTALERGAREGAIRGIRKEVRGSPSQAISAANRIADSRQVREGLRTVAPNDADRIISGAEDVRDTADRAAAIASRASPTEIQQQVAELRDVALSASFGSLGGAGTASLISRLVQLGRLSEPEAERVIKQLADPETFDEAIRFMRQRGVDIGAVTTAIVAATDIGRGSEE